jgi:regulatory protein YycI of two-component signal transduction system YycFG
MVTDMMNWDRFGSGWMFMILFLVAVFLFSIWLYKKVTGPKDLALVERALEILKKREMRKRRLIKKMVKRRKKI